MKRTSRLCPLRCYFGYCIRTTRCLSTTTLIITILHFYEGLTTSIGNPHIVRTRVALRENIEIRVRICIQHTYKTQLKSHNSFFFIQQL